MLRIYRPGAGDAKRAGAAAFERVRVKLRAAGVPTSPAGLDPKGWADEVWRVAPAEMEAFLEEVDDVRRAMAI